MHTKALITGLLGLSSTAAALGDGFVKMDFGALDPTPFDSILENVFSKMGIDLDSILSPLSQRADGGATAVNLKNQRSFYSIRLGLGSPSQPVDVLIDTGSSDLWVMSAENPECSGNGGNIDCTRYGTFAQENSTTYKDNGTAFSIAYQDQSYARGTYGSDNVDLTGGLRVDGANFAVANDSNSDVAVLGIGFRNLESSQNTYANIPLQMKDQGLIQKVAYSLYLTSAEAANGTIVFGGIDEAKYSGSLTEIDIVPSDNTYNYLQIPLSSITVHVGSQPSSSSAASTPSGIAGLMPNSLFKRDDSVDTNSVAALLDSGTTYTILSDSIVRDLVQKIQGNASYNNDLQAYVVDCSLRNTDNYLTFNFDNKADIEVPLSNLISQAGTSSGSAVCMFTIIPGSDSDATLGDNFLRSAYTVFNLEDRTISLAQIKYTQDSSITVIQ